MASLQRARVDSESAYAAALTDWLACACGGAGERAAKAMRASGAGLLADIAFAATAGHVLDFDDTFSEGVAHVSAACAPAALVLAAQLGLSLGDALDAYARGFEAMAALAAASHPRLYDEGWHPTAVCGPVGAAVAASYLLELSPAERESALAIAVLRAGGTRGAFGTDGKAIQVGLAAAAGVQAALLARAGAGVPMRTIEGPLGFTGVLGASWPGAVLEPLEYGAARPAVERNWIKLYPSCLGTHSPIEAAAQARPDGNRPGPRQAVSRRDQNVEVVVHPRARQAAHLDAVEDGLSAKFSIPYCVAHTLLRGPPRISDFTTLDPVASAGAALVRVALDGSLPEFGAVLRVAGREPVRISCPRGAPERPATPSDLAGKVIELAGDRLQGVLDDLTAPASRALAAAGL